MARYGSAWRGRPWEYWQDILNTRSRADLQDSMKTYTRGNMLIRRGSADPVVIEMMLASLDAFRPPLNEEQVIAAINGHPPPGPSATTTEVIPPLASTMGSSIAPQIPPDILHEVSKGPSSHRSARPQNDHTPYTSGSQYKNTPRDQPWSQVPDMLGTTSSVIQSDPKPPTSPEEASTDPSTHSLSGPAVEDVQRVIWELLSRRQRGLLLERGRPQLIRTMQWETDDIVVDSTEQLHGLLHDAETPRISGLNIKIARPKDQRIYEFSANGTFHPYYGAGPITTDNSCALDCCIVAARLLNVGSMASDKGEQTHDDWLHSLESIQRHFLDLLALPWEIYRPATNAAYVANFRDSLGPGFQGRDMMSTVKLWQICTSGVKQFKYSGSRHNRCTECGRERTSQVIDLQDLALDELSEETKHALGGNPSMTQMLNKHFQSEPKRCKRNMGGCGLPAAEIRRRVVCGHLPSRLVVLPHPEDSQKNIPGTASNEIKIDYDNEDGPQSANYRWIGGIYRAKVNGVPHYRVYWIDDYQDGLIIYDGLRLGGSVVGYFNRYSAEEPVPPFWSRTPDVLFYERTDSLDAQDIVDAFVAEADCHFEKFGQSVSWPAQRQSPKRKLKEVESREPERQDVGSSKPRKKLRSFEVEEGESSRPRGTRRTP